jgi:hypothetical protein
MHFCIGEFLSLIFLSTSTAYWTHEYLSLRRVRIALNDAANAQRESL